MDANKLIRIISKDLEELKTLTSEIAESEIDSSIMIDLALSRARLLCQEIELLKEVTAKPIVQADEIEEDITESENEESKVFVSEPELEIINFEEPVASEPLEKEEEQEEIVYNSEEEEIEEDITEEDEEEIENIEEKNEEIEVNFQLPEEVEMEIEDKRNAVEDDSIEEEIAEDSEEEEYIEEEEFEEEEFGDEEEFEPEEDQETDEEDEEEDSEPENEIEVTELHPGQQSGIREIQIEDLDEEDAETIQFTPVSTPPERPVMREIPKPEILIEEEKPEAETFQKDRSLNDVISENKTVETNIGNSPISSLKSSIGLNDRFLFIREIFSNNTDKYNLIIDHLDKLETIQQAVDYLKANLTLQKNETSMKFVELLKRRFTK